MLDPRRPIQLAPQAAPPDYADPAAWALRPDEPTPTSGEIPVFFVHPTTYWGGNAWNAAIDHPEASARLDYAAIPNHAGPFAAIGPVWAPRYRQASLFSSLTHRYDAQRARAFAYADVAEAFEAFLAALPSDTPFALAGVEQGGLHVLGLLQDVAAAQPVRERLAAVYVIEQAAPLDLFQGPLSPLTPCDAPDAYGCLVAFSARQEDDAREIWRLQDRSMTWTEAGRLTPTAGRTLACVNPVLGLAGDDFAPPRLHLGGVDASGLGAEVAPAAMANQTSAQCRDGVLVVDRPASPSLREGWSWGGRFKPPRANLFYADIRADAERRAAAFLQFWEVERFRAPPLEETVSISETPFHRVPDR